MKKLVFVLLACILLMTGCQSIKGVNFNQMIVNSTNIKSGESKMTASWHFIYNRVQVRDKDLLKVLDLLNNAKLEVSTKMQNLNTMSISGNLILQKGKIPFRLYADRTKTVYLIDNAKKPIVIPTSSETLANEQWIHDFQKKITNAIVEKLPNPKHITVQPKSDTVHGSKVAGYKVHAEIYANEAPELLLAFVNNLLADEKALAQMVDAMNEFNKATGDNSSMTLAEFREGLKELQAEMAQSLPELKKSQLFSTKNYLKTDLFVDKNFFQRKSSANLNVVGIDNESGLTGIQLRVNTETWNINKPVTAEKIRYSSYLTEKATFEEFLATLDPKRSVLYKILLSFAQ
ncbi:hypothetical protein [Anoxybacteroides tepidamans]|uniref:hypothetical protein n=1 Tax=Anoxybacteroides tepidamans TaxID=265948 RepID=UPI000486B38A|nr:hypothetical protein [Anoxybacillus tepidamans]